MLAFQIGYIVGYLFTLATSLSLILVSVGGICVILKWHEALGRKLLKGSIVIFCLALAVMGGVTLICTLML